jgi:hypothetical protein
MLNGKIIFLPILLSFIFSGCTVDWNNELKNQNESLKTEVAELRKTIDDESFSKKQECVKYKDKFEQDLKIKEKELRSEDYFRNETLVEIFYSKHAKSCFAVSQYLERWKSDTTLDSDGYYITDLLSGDVTIYTGKSIAESYYPRLKNLKGD